jgi:ATP-dependent RNA helicase DeaD
VVQHQLRIHEWDGKDDGAADRPPPRTGGPRPGGFKGKPRPGGSGGGKPPRRKY